MCQEKELIKCPSFLNEISGSRLDAGYTNGRKRKAENLVVQLNKPKIIVALDWENIFLSYRKNCANSFSWNEIRLLDSYIHGNYEVLAKAAYVDSSISNRSIRMLDTFGYNNINVPSRIMESEMSPEQLIKNAVDVEMTLDVYDKVLSIQDLDAVVILSGDGDFLPLVKRIKKRGVAVVVFACKGHLSNRLAKFANQVFYLEDLNLESHLSNKQIVKTAVQVKINQQLLENIRKEDHRSIPLPNALNHIYKSLGSRTLKSLGVKKVRELVERYPAMFKGLRIEKDRICELNSTPFSPSTFGGEVLC